jgi:hypothetical protein
MSDKSEIDTADLGLALAFLSPKTSGVKDKWKVTFDTGVVMFVPDRVFSTMTFHLQEKDPA